MPTTTNYGWTTPADTDLVKDGAAAIRTLGSSIDTSVKSLNAGTTAGDIDYYTSSTAKARVGIGSTGQVLTVAGGVPSWATASSGGMTLISTTSLTGATTTISSIPQTYNTLYLIVKNFRPSSNNNSWRMNFNSDTATRYSTAGGTDFATYTNTFGVAYIDSLCDTSSTTNDGFSTIEIPNYTNTDTWKDAEICTNMSNGTTPTSLQRTMAFGVYNQKVAITSITFKSAAGTLSAGTVLLYGVK